MVIPKKYCMALQGGSANFPINKKISKKKDIFLHGGLKGN